MISRRNEPSMMHTFRDRKLHYEGRPRSSTRHHHHNHHHGGELGRANGDSPLTCEQLEKSMRSQSGWRHIALRPFRLPTT
jgi:hypothetical protein